MWVTVMRFQDLQKSGTGLRIMVLKKNGGWEDLG